MHLVEDPWLVITRGSGNWPRPDQIEPLRAVFRDEVPVTLAGNRLGKTAQFAPHLRKGKPVKGLLFLKDPERLLVNAEDGEIRRVPQGDLTLGEKNPWFELSVLGITIAGIT